MGNNININKYNPIKGPGNHLLYQKVGRRRVTKNSIRKSNSGRSITNDLVWKENTEQTLIKPSAEDAIPKIIHFFWIGNCIPTMVQSNIDQAKRLHPGWEVKLWHGTPPDMPYDILKIFYSSNLVCARSDIFRWWVLKKYGGFYLDCDVYCYRNLEPLRRYDFFTSSYSKPGKKGLHCGVLGSKPNSKGAQIAVRIMQETWNAINLSGYSNRLAYGPNLMGNVWHTDKKSITILPLHYFYWFNTHEESLTFSRLPSKEQLEMLVNSKCSDPETVFGVHIRNMPQSPCHNGKTHKIGVDKKLDRLLIRLPSSIRSGIIRAPNAQYIRDYISGYRPDLDLSGKSKTIDFTITDSAKIAAGAKSRFVFTI